MDARAHTSVTSEMMKEYYDTKAMNTAAHVVKEKVVQVAVTDAQQVGTHGEHRQ